MAVSECVHCKSGDVPIGHLYHFTHEGRFKCGNCVCADYQQQKGETMPKGEGQLREALEKIVAEYDAYIKGPQIMPTAGLIGALVAGELALQSTPSSPPLAPNKPGSGVLSPETIEKAVEIADKFFAGAGAPSDAGQPERERFLAVHEITCELESLAEGKGYPCPELHVSRPLGKALVAYTEKIQRDASNAALEKLRERIQSEVLTLFAPAPRPAEKG